MAVNFDAVLNLSKAGLMNPEQMGYKDSLEIIKDESVKIQKSFVKIGWYLKHIRDDELYKEDGYVSINDCAADQLGYSQSTVSRLINICEKFSKNHNSPELDDKYAGFDKSQMIEMLPMNDKQMEKVKPDMTIKQIRDIKDEGKTGRKDTKESDEDSVIPGQTSIERDFPEYMPSETTIFDDSEEENGNQKYATSHKRDETVLEVKVDSLDDVVFDGEYREGEDLEAVVVSQPDDTTHDERWFVEQYVKFEPEESAELMEICRREKNNSDRVKAIQSCIALYGYYNKSCREYAFKFHGFTKGVDFCIGEDEAHLTYECLALELTRIAEAEVETPQPEKSTYGLEKTEYPEKSLLDIGLTDKEPIDVLQLLHSMLEEAKGLLQDYLNLGDIPERTVCRQELLVDALADMVGTLEGLQEKEEPAVEILQELPLLKNNDQRKLWINDYKSWGLWYRDENIDVNYFKFDFTDGSRLVAAEYPQRHSYYSREVRDEIFYHLIPKNKVTDGEVYDEKYRHATHSETELVEFLKNLQKKR